MTQDDRLSEILYLSYDGLTDPLGQSQILPYVIGLASSGFRVSIISFEKKQNANAQPGVRAICSSSGVKWYPLIYHKKPPVFSTIFDLFVVRRLAFSLVRHQSVAIVHCRSYIMAIVGLWLKQSFKVRFIFDMRGFWVDERLDGGLWNLRSPISRLMYTYFKKKERSFLQHADHIVCLTRKGASIVIGWGAVGPVTIIPCCADESLFNPKSVDPEARVQLARTLGLEFKLVILYLGSVGTWYMLDEMLDFFRVLLRRIPRANFVIVTNDSTSTIQSVVKSKGIDPESIYITQCERRDVPLFLSVADFSIFFIKPAFSKQASFPTKLAESLFMGVPVIANGGVGDMDSLFRENEFGFLIDRFSNKDYEKAVDFIIRHRKAEGPRDVATRKFSLASGVAAYKKIYESLLSETLNIR